MHAKFYNPGPNYLSAGEEALPTLYFAYFLIYAGSVAAWIYFLRSRKDHVSTHVFSRYVKPLLVL